MIDQDLELCRFLRNLDDYHWKRKRKPMTKRERLEDLGRLREMLKVITDDEIFEHTDSKHGYELWVKLNHDKLEDNGLGEQDPIGLDHIFRKMRYLNQKLHDCLCIAAGYDDDD